MNVFNTTTSINIGTSLAAALSGIRYVKNFNATKYIDQKSCLLNKYMQKFGLSTCIVAVSGGIDSAVVLGLVNYAANCPNSPIKKIIPVCLPASGSPGVTGQGDATNRGVKVCKYFGLVPTIIDIGDIAGDLKQLVDNHSVPGQNWAAGQLVPYLRTPTLYYLASLSAQEKRPAIICGTTNKDEGAYLGYVGKASDGMVDVQMISDLHKSEVYAVAKKMAIPVEIINVVPTGDMYDGRVDEEVFGASYDFVELYLTYLSYSRIVQIMLMDALSDEGRKEFKLFSANLENLHRYNLHKYLSRSPAVHLDIFPNEVPGEWGVPGKLLEKLLAELK